MEQLSIGSTIPFGGYNWLVLDVQADRILLITQDIIQQRPYHEVYKNITWADCSLRKYLNGPFLESFNPRELARILLVNNSNVDNQWYGTPGGEDTNDRVFLLSLDEVCRYFGDSSDKLYNKGKNQRYWFERKDINNPKRSARFGTNTWFSWWWLRSPGRVGAKAVYIWGDGNIGIQGNNILKGNLDEGRCKGGVRPALWVRCSPL